MLEYSAKLKMSPLASSIKKYETPFESLLQSSVNYQNTLEVNKQRGHIFAVIKVPVIESLHVNMCMAGCNVSLFLS